MIGVHNSTNEDVNNLTITYYTLGIDGPTGIIKSAPMSKSLQTLPPGEGVDFNTSNYFSMGDDYTLTFDTPSDGHHTIPINIPQMLAQEAEVFGAPVRCSDSLEVFDMQQSSP